MLVGGLGFVYALAIGGLQWWKWQNFGYNGFDLGIYAQAVWGLSHGLGFLSSIHDPSYLGDHLELWLVPLAGIYRLFPSALTLLWAQTLVIAVSVIPLALISRRLIGTRGAIVASVIWLAHPLMYNAAMYEFHGLVFALPLLLWSIWAFQARRLGWWLIFLGLTLAVREDLPLLVVGWSALAALERRGWRWWLPPLVASIAWFVIAQTIIASAQPAGTYKFLAFYGWMGSTFGDIATFPFRHPWVFLQHLFQPRNWLTVIGFLMSFGFLPLLGWRRLLPVGLLFVQLLLVGAESDSVLRLHYVIPYLPFLAWSALWVLHRLRTQPIRWLPAGLGFIVLPMLAVVGPLYAHLIYGPAEWPWRARPDTGLTDQSVLAWGIRQIPAEASILATFNLLPHLANREDVYSLNYLHLGRRQYSEIPYRLPGPVDVAIIDWQQYYHYQFLYRQTLFEGQTGPQRLEKLLADQGLRLKAWVDNLAIYAPDGSSEYRPSAALGQASPSEQNLGLIEPPIVSTIESPAGGTQTEIRLRWFNRDTRERPLSLRLFGRQDGNVVWEQTRLLGQGPVTSQVWKAGQAWDTRYRVVFPKDLRGTLELSAEVVELDGRLRLDRIRKFTPVISQESSLLKFSLGTLSL